MHIKSRKECTTQRSEKPRVTSLNNIALEVWTKRAFSQALARRRLLNVESEKNSNTLPSSLLVRSNILTSQSSSIVNSLLDNFFPSSKIQSNVQHEIINQLTNRIETPSTEEIPLIITEELLQADIVNSVSFLAPVLMNIFNEYLRINYFPNKWKRAKASIIRIPNREKYDKEGVLSPFLWNILIDG